MNSMSCCTTLGSHSWIPEELSKSEAILASLGTWSEDIFNALEHGASTVYHSEERSCSE